MADNVAVTAGTGTTIAADEVVDGTLGTVKVQYVKLMDGTLDGTSKAAVGTNGLAVSAKITGATATLTDRSGTITAGGTAQTLMASNSSRSGYLIQNNSTADLWISSVGTAAATQPSLRLSAGDYYESPAHGVPTAAISIIGATTGQTFTAREW